MTEEEFKNKIIQGDALEELKKLSDESIDCAITSPPYWALRDYGVKGQLGLEPTFQEYITKLCDMFDEVKRVLKKEGTCWVNIGDTYGGSGKGVNRNGMDGSTIGTTHRTKELNKLTKESWVFKEAPKTTGDVDKSLCQIPSRFAIEMTNRGWILRNEIIWHKPNCMPSSADDRFTVDFEKVFFFVKSKKYYFEQQLEKSSWFEKDHRAIDGPTYGNKALQGEYAINKGGAFRDDGMKNKRTVWRINTKGYSEAHFATFPEDLIVPMVKAGCPKGGIVLDIFMGAGTTGLGAKKLGRNYLGIELNPEYIKIAEQRLRQEILL